MKTIILLIFLSIPIFSQDIKIDTIRVKEMQNIIYNDSIQILRSKIDSLELVLIETKCERNLYKKYFDKSFKNSNFK